MHTDLDHQQEPVARRLRELPGEMQAPYDWEEFQRRAREQGASPSQRARFVRQQAGRRYAAIAAALLIAVGGFAVWTRLRKSDAAVEGAGLVERTRTGEWASTGDQYGADGNRNHVRDVGPSTAAPERESAPTRATSAHTRIDAAPNRVDAAAAHAVVVERWLASLPAEPVVVRFGTRVAVADLEDRIAQVDDLLTAMHLEDIQPARVVALQRERVRLVSSLAQVRYAETLAAESP